MNLRKLLIFSITFLFSLQLIVASSGCAKKQETPQPVTPQAEVETVQPVISDLKADHQVAALGKTQVVCTATEAGADNLTYNWGATDGTITGAGSTITWTAPGKSGDYMITVVVSDGNGGAAKQNVIINVPEKPNNPPVIDAIRIELPVRTITLKPNMTDEDRKKALASLIALKYEVVNISCMAHDDDNDKLNYVWQATGGKLSGTGANVQWIAPGWVQNLNDAPYTITVEVSDDNGGSDVYQIPIIVHCCAR